MPVAHSASETPMATTPSGIRLVTKARTAPTRTSRVVVTGSTGSSTLRRRLERERELDEEARPEAGGALGDPAPRGLGLRGARDVDVGPRGPVHELLEEQAGGDGPGVGTAEVRHVGDGRVELAAVGPDERQLPDRFVGPGGRGPDLVDDAGVVAHDPGHLGAEGPQAG